MKKMAVIFFLVVVLIGAVACSGNSGGGTDQAPDLSGQWKQVNSKSKDSFHGAIIDGDSIEIYWVNGDSRALYWAGSFDLPATGEEPYSWTSNNYTEKTEKAMLASQDDTKVFTYEKNKISYSASAMGATTTVRLEKGEWAPGLEIEKQPEPGSSAPAVRDQSGFDAMTNQTISFGGMEFSVPSYFDGHDEKSTEMYQHYFPQQSDRKCSLMFQLKDVSFSQADFDNSRPAMANSLISSISSGQAVNITSENTLMAGLSAYALSFQKGDVTEPTTVNGCFAFEANSQKLILVVQIYDGDDASDIDYSGDFWKIIESAKLAPLPEPESTVSQPEENSGLRPEFKEAMDNYEAFFNSYCEFMGNYQTSNNTLEMLSDYAKMMTQYTETMRQCEAWENQDLNDEEMLYYLQVQNDVNQKLLDVIGSN